MTVLAIAAWGAAVIACCGGAFWCGRRSVHSWNEFSKGRGRPLLAGVPDQALASQRSEWPARESRWPVPVPSTGAHMTRPLAQAYARLADRAHRRALATAQVIALIGGAWLGTSLPELWRMVRLSQGVDIASLGFAQLVGLVITIQVGVLIGERGHEYAAMSVLYRRHANRATEAVVQLTTPHRSLLRRLFQRPSPGMADVDSVSRST